MVGWLAPGLLSLALLASPAGGFTTRAMYAMIDEQLRQYPQPESTGDALRYLVDMIEREEHDYHNTIFALDGVLYFDRRFLEVDKNLKHVAMVASVGAYGPPAPNCFWRFFASADGYPKGDARRRHPVLVIAKPGGYGDPGVLAPNPYFTDLRDWDLRRRAIVKEASAKPYRSRDPRVFWRGEVGSHDADVEGRRDHGASSREREAFFCGEERGNFARLQALSLTRSHPDRVDARCISREACAPRDDTKHRCAELPYSAAMRNATRHLDALVGREGSVQGRKRVIQRRFNVDVPRARVPKKDVHVRDRSER